MLPIGMISVFYLIMNFIYVRVTGIAIYPPITWDTTEGILTPLVALLASTLLFAIIERLNRFKLRYLGYHRIVDILEYKSRYNKEVMSAL
jgi:hypothetical protein